MTTEYEWVDRRDECKRDFGAMDTALGWIIYSVALLYLII